MNYIDKAIELASLAVLSGCAILPPRAIREPPPIQEVEMNVDSKETQRGQTVLIDII